jgi:hypothetical protein
VDPKLIRRYLSETEILRAPKRTLATFGATQIDYQLVSAVEDLPNRTRLRHGKVVSLKPKIITPDAFIERFQGFGDESAEFAKWLGGAYGDLLRSLEYNFSNQGFATRVLSEPPAAVTARIVEELDARPALDQALIRCPDAGWSLALMKFALDESARSFPGHVRDLERRGLFESAGDDKADQRREIERLFRAAKQDRAVLPGLGRKLSEYGLFAEYEDRYYSLLGS